MNAATGLVISSFSHYGFQTSHLAYGQSLIHRHNYPWFLAGHLASRVEVVGQSRIHKYCFPVCPADTGLVFLGGTKVAIETFNQIYIFV